ncbi:MAG: glycosyltransferase [Opitutales bacterium]|nr:glycosyltransferase [Opitutales bacterium]
MTNIIRIAIPSLNAVNTIGSTLAALRPLQKVAEIVVVDSFSEDGTRDLVEQAGIELRSCPPGNMYEAINEGLEDAQTPWLTYINADDLLYSHILAKRLKAATAKASVYYGRVDYIDSENRFLRSWLPAHPSSVLPLYQTGYSPMLQQGTFFSRELFQKLGGFDTRFHYVADADFWYRAAEKGFSFCRQTKNSVAAFRLHPSQITNRLKNPMTTEHKKMVASHTPSPPNFWRIKKALWYWKWENKGSYAERFLRNSILGLRPRFCDSYALPKDTDPPE